MPCWPAVATTPERTTVPERRARGPVSLAAVRQVALGLFAERGYRVTTMNDIAEVLGIRAPSLYNHVPSKHEILRQIMVETMERLLADHRVAVASTADVSEQLRRATEAHVRYHARHRREAFVGNREIPSLERPARELILSKRDEYERGFRTLIERGREQSVFEVKSARLASYSILEMGIGVATWFREDGPLSEAEVAYHYGEFALRIVGARERGAGRG